MILEQVNKYSTEIILPLEKDLGINVRWKFGEDIITRRIRSKIGLRPLPELEDFITSIVRREKVALKKLDMTIVEGRKINFQLNTPVDILGVKFDTITIGGFGYQKFDDVGVSTASSPLDAFINPPKAEHFQSQATNPIGEFFTGAYTKEKAILKVSRNIFLLSELSKVKGDIPFIVPIPLFIGSYDNLRDQEGNPAYYIVWLSPYQGKRTGTAFISKSQSEEYINMLLDKAPRIVPALRFINDKLSVFHSQVVPGNFFVPDQSPILLADLEDIEPIKNSDPTEGRVINLSAIIESVLNTAIKLKVDLSFDQKKQFIINVLSFYLSEEDSIDLGSSLSSRSVYTIVKDILDKSLSSNNFNIEQSVLKISLFEQMLKGYLVGEEGVEPSWK